MSSEHQSPSHPSQLVQKVEQKYDLSVFGFLTDCSKVKLPDNFSHMNELIDSIEETESGSSIRDIISNLPQYDHSYHSISNLSSIQVKYLYSILSMIVNRYVWCTGMKDARNYYIIPEIIGVPYLCVSMKLGVSPALTHAAVDLFNWHIKDNTKEFSLDNINTNSTMTGNPSESHFYKVMIAIEGVCGSLLVKMILCDNEIDLRYLLKDISCKLSECTLLVKEMYRGCDPEYFFNGIRIYLGGSDNDNLPDGLKISNHNITLKYVGGSAAQSSLIQSFDTFLGMKHNSEFLMKMRDYMPKKHRKFVEKLESNYNEKMFEHNKELREECIGKLRKFREAHMGLIRTYISKFIQDSKNDNTKNAHGNKGSGRTVPEIFCKSIIDSTTSVKRSIISTRMFRLTVLTIIVWCLWHFFG